MNPHTPAGWTRGPGLALICLALLAACRGPGEAGPPPARLVGSASHPERVALPADAELRVRLLEPAAPGGRSALVAEETRRDIGQSPFPFELGYDPRRLAPGRVHRLEAEIAVGDQIWSRGARSISRLHTGPPEEPVEVRLHRTFGGSGSSSSD